ncbi:MAG TPA: hypothetical protein VE646_07090 [Actinomycetota bacterium]|nr:hypothetical protein [Actinomycetota bacterium]
MLAAAGVVLPAACADPGTGPGDGVAYFPLETGHVWTYAPADPLYGQPFQWQVVERRGDTVTLARPPAGSHPGPVTLVDGVDGVDLLLESGTIVPFYRFTAGTSWVHHDPWECDDGSEWAAVDEGDAIATPAGTFLHTLRLERRSAASCTDAGTTAEWWAPDVGLVRWEELNFYAGGPLTFDLVGHSRR